MHVLYMSLGSFYNLNGSSVHIDLLKRTAKDHDVWLVCKNEEKPTEVTEELGIHVLRVHTGEQKKVGIIKKGINTIFVESQFKNAIIKHLADVRFDLVLYTTPPITFANAIEFIKNRDGARTYLMLKDIFPQNAVDLGMMCKHGVKGLLYQYFRGKEKQLYRISDRIGCMSQANVDYVLRHNPEVDPAIVEICPNSIEVVDKSVDTETRHAIRVKYGIPLDKKVFVYGGNLGKPQGIPFIIECLKQCCDLEDAYFLIVGNGTEYGKLEEYANSGNQNNLKLMRSLPKEDYDTLVAACDVGLIFLDHRFTIPNFPSRILSYMQAKLPILACTDPNTDIGKVIVDGGFGWWCESNRTEKFQLIAEEALKADTHRLGQAAFSYLQEHYTVDIAYNTIMKSVGET